MIQFEQTAACPLGQTGIDDATVEHMARTLIELEACGRVVTDDMVAAYGDFTSKEIILYGKQARDRAIEMKRAGRQ